MSPPLNFVRGCNPPPPKFVCSAVQQRGRGRTEEISSQKLADFECRFTYDSYGRGRVPFWPFLGEDFRAFPGGPLFSRPLCFTADLWSACAVGENFPEHFGGFEKFFVRASKWDAKRHRWSNPTRGFDIKMDGTFSVALYIASQEPIVRARGSLRISFCHDQP